MSLSSPAYSTIILNIFSIYLQCYIRKYCNFCINHQTYFRKLKKESLFYLPIMLPTVVFPLSCYFKILSFFSNFLSLQRTCFLFVFCHYFRQICWLQISSLSFSSSESVLIALLFSKDVFTGYRMLGRQCSFFFQPVRNVVPLPHSFQDF